MSELALLLIEENKKTKATFLDLGNCGLASLPKELGELIWLEELKISNHPWKGIKDKASQNKILDESHAITSIASLKNLKRLDLSSTYSTMSYTRGEFLFIRGRSRLASLTPLSGLTNLEILDVSYTLVTDLTPLANLKNLQQLNIKATEVKNLTPLTMLSGLHKLDISYTQIAELSQLSKLEYLQSLNASYTQLIDIKPLTNLLSLKHLDLSYTEVVDLDPLEKLINLQVLDISKTPIVNITSLTNLACLQKLDVSETEVTDLSPLLPLIKLGIRIDWFPHFTDGYGVNVSDCPLTNPPVEIVSQGNEAILRYFEEKERGGTIKVREAKLLLVGQGKAGKTTLKRKLQDRNAVMPAPGDTTRGIDIISLDEKMPQTGEPLRINVWDFGGQDIQHYAHQFFLTGNSVYALVTNERIQDSVHLPYWLNIIEMLGKKSPVLLIQNKDGGHCQPLLNEAAIRARFGNVHNRVFQTDLSRADIEHEFAELRKEIIHKAALLPHVERDYLASFAALRTQLETLADQESHYLRWIDYLKLMPELSEELMRDYANALTFLGVCQYFPNDASLREYVFLRPKWIIDALFALLLHPSLEAKRGHFNENDTFAIWNGAEYQGMHALLVRMMEEFELCYRVESNSRTYILPQRLPSESKSYGWDKQDNAPVQYVYKFMPKGILTRLICRLHPRIETDPEHGQRVWCDAVIFTLPDNKGRVFAREVFSENIIELKAGGVKRTEILNEVIRTMDDINRDSKYDNLKVEKLVPCPCNECVRSDEGGFHEFDALQKRIDKGKSTSECKKSGEDVSIDDIFGESGVQRPDLRNSGSFNHFKRGELAIPLKIFISYSHAQREYFPIFKTDFIQYAKIPGLDIRVFGDDVIPMGTAWDEFLQSKVADCDVMVLLVSQEFMNSQYIQEKEFGAALERLKAGRNILIVPIYFAPCSFSSDDELKRLQFYKPHGDQFDEEKKGEKFAYIDLVKFSKEGMPNPNSNRQHYMNDLITKLTPDLKKLKE